MSVRILAGFVLAGILAGCTSIPAIEHASSPEKLKTFSTQALCDAYGHSNQARLLDELRGRGQFSDQDLEAIGAHAMRVGMTDKAAQCSWGTDYAVFKVAGGDSVRWVYLLKTSTLFVDNGAVTGFQN
jgi:hypothetical protein